MIEAVEQRAWAVGPEPQREGAPLPGPGESPGLPTTGPAAPAPSRRQLVGRLLHAAWRRRFLLVVPLLLMIPAALLIMSLVPSTYTAHTLLLLQEGEKGNPLARDTPLLGSMQQRVAGLEALLKSDQVLIPMLDLPTGADPKRVSAELQELRKNLTLELIGSDFIAVDLRGPKSDGLGDRLSRILARFFEVLLAENAPNAANVVIQRRRDELQAAENERSRLQAEFAKTLPAGVDATKAKLQALEAKLQQQRASNGGIDQIRESENAIADLKNHLNDGVELQRRLAFAERESGRQRTSYEAYLNRFGDLAGGQGASVLNAPGRIKVIDPPTDPLTRSSSRLKFLAAGLLGSILIGMGLAWAAENLDPAIHYPDQLIKASGLPVLAHLPRIQHAPVAALAMEAQQGTREAPRRRRTIVAVVIVAAALAAFAASFAPKVSPADGYEAVRGWIARAL